MLAQCRAYAPGNTDLSWTRLTPWRALLAAALDQHPLKVTGASVTAERISPSADLLVAWLADRLKVEVRRRSSDGPGITEVTMDTKEGPITISRADGRLATFSSPNRPDRPVALKRREVPALLSEELRRLDEDDVYARTAHRLVALHKPVPSSIQGVVMTERDTAGTGPESSSTRTPPRWPATSPRDCSTAWRRHRPAVRCPRSGSPAAPSPTRSTARSHGAHRTRRSTGRGW